jgi:hypothetical protein
MNACTQRGHYFHSVRQFGAPYTFVREVDPAVYETTPFSWDDGHVIFFSMVLSRLIRDNGHSFEFAARIVDHMDGMQQVIPVNAPGYVPTYRPRRDRDWLTASEAVELRQLFADHWPVRDTLPWKVIHALNLAEDAVHLRILQRAMLLITIALEGLIRSHRKKISKQFRERIPQLAGEVGVEGVDEEFARSLYDARSDAAHASPVSMFEVRPEPEHTAGAEQAEQPEQPQGEPEPPEAEVDIAAPVALAQDLLRAATRKAIQDPVFRQTFESDETVAAKWPVKI